MNTVRLLATLLLLGLTLSPAHAQRERGSETLSAFAGLHLVHERFGNRAVERVVEMHGVDGQDQPERWSLIVHDADSPWLLREFVISGYRTEDLGDLRAAYLEQAPTGFMDRTNLRLDSTAAFRILNGLASEASLGFNSVDYVLRCREFSDEPIWSLTAVDVDGLTVGKVDISGTTGEVLRTVWYVWSADRRQEVPLIVDSYLRPGSGVAVQPASAPAPTTTLPPARVPALQTPAPRTEFVPPVVPPSAPMFDPNFPPSAEVEPLTQDQPTARMVEETVTPPPGPAMPPADPALQPAIPQPGPTNPNAIPEVPTPPGLPLSPEVPGRRIVDDPNGDPVIVEPIPPAP